MKQVKYFKRQCDAGLGLGCCYNEFTDGWATRQVESYGSRWFSSFNSEYHEELGPALCDQPLESLEFAPEDEISREEFESVWAKAIAAQEP